MMKYSENVTLFTLHDFNYKALVNKIRNSKKNIVINLQKVKTLFCLIQDETMFMHKQDFAIELRIEISGGRQPTIEIELKQDKNIWPHISNKSKSIRLIVSLQDFNCESESALFEHAINSYENRLSRNIEQQCNLVAIHFLKVIKKFQDMFGCNNDLYEKTFSHGIYPEENKIECEDFDIKIKNNSLEIHSKFKIKVLGCEKGLFFIKTNQVITDKEDDIMIYFEFYNQSIKLTYTQFMQADIKNIEKTIVGLLRLIDVDVNNLIELRNELKLKEIMSI